MVASPAVSGLPQPPVSTPTSLRRKLSTQGTSRLPKRSVSSLSHRTTSSTASLHPDESLEILDELATVRPVSKQAGSSAGLRRLGSLQPRASPVSGLARPPHVAHLKKRSSASNLKDVSSSGPRRLAHSSTESNVSVLSDRIARSSTAPLNELHLPAARGLMAPPPMRPARPTGRAPKQSTRPTAALPPATKLAPSRCVSAVTTASSRRDSAASWATDSTPSPPRLAASPRRLHPDRPSPTTIRRAKPKPSIELSDLLTSPSSTVPRLRPSSPGLTDVRSTRAMRRELTASGTPPSARPSLALARTPEPRPSLARTPEQHRSPLLAETSEALTRRTAELATLRGELEALQGKAVRTKRVAAEGRARRLHEVADGWANERNATKGEVETLRFVGRDLAAWRDLLLASMRP